MFEVGKDYKLKKLDLPMIANDDATYTILSIRDNIATCINNDNNEHYTFLTDFLIDPDQPENDTYTDIKMVEGLNAVIKPTNLAFWKYITEEGGAAGGACGVASCASGCGCASTQAAISTGQSTGTSSGLGTVPCGTVGHIYGAMVNGKPVQGKSVKKKKKKKHEDLEQEIKYDMENPERVFAQSNELNEPEFDDAINLLLFGQDKSDVQEYLDLLDCFRRTGRMLDFKKFAIQKYGITNFNPDRIGAHLTEAYESKESQEELFERALDLRNSFYRDENMSDRTESMLSYLDVLESMKRNNLLNTFVEYAKQRNVKELALDLLESTDDDYVISDMVSKRLERLGFTFADTKDCVYKREGNYKHLIRYDNDTKIIKYKVFNGDDCIDEKVYNLEDKSDVNKTFDQISSDVEGRE